MIRWFEMRPLLHCFKDCLKTGESRKMSSGTSISSQLATFPKVQLHLHLDGAVRHSTLLDLAISKRIDLKGAKTVEQVKQVVCTHQPADLAKVLAAFDIFMPCIVGDKQALERVAYELCQDQASNSVVYFEVRYSPHLLSKLTKHTSWTDQQVYKASEQLNPAEVVEAVTMGLTRGQKDFGVKCSSILCCIQGYPQYNQELLRLAVQFRGKGVVAIDVAGCAHGGDEKYEESVIHCFKEAAKLGIHRTAHAGESAGPASVVTAVEVMKVSRIGHGYRLVLDEAAYAKYALSGVIHFEGCPYSSVMTGAVSPDWTHHPMARWAKDDINFSISTDDPTCFDNCMNSEVELSALQIGLTLDQIKKCQLNAAKAAFLPEAEKTKLVNQIQKAIDINKVMQ